MSGYDAAMIKKCLEELKELEPAGIFAKDLSECLVLQLKRAGVEDLKLYEMAECCLDEILKGHISRVTRQLHISTVKAKEYMHILASLNPRPLAGEGRETPYIVPDILVVREGDSWKAELNDRWMGEYHLNDYYIHMMETAQDQELKEYFAEKLKRARYVMECVEQRRATILKIVYEILERQSGYFLSGASLKPMMQEEIAQSLGIHSSTVSRAIRGKYLQYQRTVLLKDLFSTAVSREEQTAAEDVKKKIRMLIDQEDKEKPFSDSGLEKLLAKEGIRISRRTIAKYRGQMGIPDSEVRSYI